MKFWEIDRLLDKRVRTTRGKKEILEYLIRWKGFGSDRDKWYKVKNLGKAQDLISDYEKEIQLYNSDCVDYTDHINISVITKIPAFVVPAIVRSGPFIVADLVRYSGTESLVTPALS